MQAFIHKNIRYRRQRHLTILCFVIQYAIMTVFLDKNQTFYHGTLSAFERFRPLSHFGSYRAASQRIENCKEPRIETLDMSAREQYFDFSHNDGTAPAKCRNIIPVQLNLTNTYELQDINATPDYTYWRDSFLHYLAVDQQLPKCPDFYDYIFHAPFHMDIADVRAELATDTLYPFPSKRVAAFQPATVDKYHLCFQRMIHFWESRGFDGFHYMNYYEDRGHISYVVFRPENIIRQDRTVVHIPFMPTTQEFVATRYRDFTRNERHFIKEQVKYHETVDNLKMAQVADPTPMTEYDIIAKLRGTDIVKEFYTRELTDKVMPNIAKVSRQPQFGYHGLTHSYQVALFAIDIAIAIKTDPRPVMIAAALHDCARTDDSKNREHGAECEPIARKFIARHYPTLSPFTVTQIVNAIQMHPYGLIPHDIISACLWDADRIRMSWDFGFSRKYFSTLYGLLVAAMKPHDQEKYICYQNEFLVRTGIKNFARIQYERNMDAKYIADHAQTNER